MLLPTTISRISRHRSCSNAMFAHSVVSRLRVQVANFSTGRAGVKDMRALFVLGPKKVQQNQSGEATAINCREQMEFRNISIPKPVRNQVLIKVQAASFNPIDGRQRKGLAPHQPSPYIPGRDCSGMSNSSISI